MHKNFLAYENYEVFDDLYKENIYKLSKLKSCDEHVEFIKNIENNKKINFLELGSGNSKLLYNLFLNDLLLEGYGLEISKSRFNFAEKWKKDIGCNNIFNFNENFLDFDFSKINKLDLVFCVDLAFQFCEPIKKGSDYELLNKVYNNLNFKGKIVLELDGCKSIIDSIKISNRLWDEFPETDPWRFSLWDCSFENSELNWKKTFISRKGEFFNSEVILRIYKKEEIIDLFERVGFKNVKLYKNWKMDSFENDYESFIVTGEKI